MFNRAGLTRASRRRCVMMMLLCAAGVLRCAAAQAVSLETADGDVAQGDLVRFEKSSLTIKTDASEQHFRMEDLAAVAFDPNAPITRPGPASAPLIDNDGPHTLTEASGAIGLKAGRHEFHLFYFQNADARGLKLFWTGPNFGRQPIPEGVWFHNPNAPPHPALLDKQNLRLPVPPEGMKWRLTYSYFENNSGKAWTSVNDMASAGTPVTTGYASRIDLSLAERGNDFGMRFDGYIDIPNDGEYTFHLASDDGAQLYIGTAPTLRRAAANLPIEDGAWVVHTAARDRITAHVETWTKDKLTLRIGGVEPATAVCAAVTQLWRPDANRAALMAQAPAGDGDLVFIRREGRIGPARGKVVGIDGNDLVFNFEGKEHRAELTRVVGIVLADAPTSDQPAPTHILHLRTGESVTGRWTGLAGDAVEWSSASLGVVKAPVAAVVTIRALRGRQVWLSELDPAKVEQSPWFDRVVPWRRDTNLSGGRIKLADGYHDRGVAMHSRTRLDYDLDAGFERFKAVLGFELPDGRKGRATVRVLADGKPVLDLADARGDAPVTPIDLDVKGVKRLTLEVDFGQNEDTADRVVFADAQLVRAK